MNQEALLRGLLRCARCGCAMTPTYTAKGGWHHSYYVCQSVMKRGAHACPDGRVSVTRSGGHLPKGGYDVPYGQERWSPCASGIH